MTDDILKVEKFLKGLNKPVLSSGPRMQIRDNLVKNILLEKKVEGFVKDASREVALSGVEKALLKEKVMSYASTSRAFVWGQIFSYSKRFVGALTLSAFLFGTFGFAFVNVRVASADAFTYVDEVSGGANVYRDGAVIEVYPKMVLEEGDKVVTADESFVSIKFLDNSVARLGEETTIYLEGVKVDKEVMATDVQIEVEDGVIWSRVLNLINTDSSFTVKVGDVYAYAKRAAFNVSKSQDEVKVEVYSSVVNVVTTDNADKKVKTGQAAIVRNANEDAEVVRVVSRVSDDSWVSQNLNQDKAHLAKIEEESAESLKLSAGVLPENPLYKFKDLKTGVIKLFTFDDVAIQKLDLESAEMKFVESAVLLEDGKVASSDAETVFVSYIEQVDEFKELINAVRESGDTLYADELDSYLGQKIKERQNDLKSVLPASPMYVAKGYAFQAEVAAASSDIEKTSVKQSQATQKLFEAQDLMETGDTELAAQAIGDYAKTVSEVKQDVISLPEGDKAEAASFVVNAIKDDKEILSSIQESSQVSSPVSLGSQDVNSVAIQVERLVVDPIADNLEAEVSNVTVISPFQTDAVVSKPVQRDGEYGVPVVGTGSASKPLDPLLDLNR